MTVAVAIFLILIGFDILLKGRRTASANLILLLVVGMSFGYSNDSILIWLVYSLFFLLIIFREKTRQNLFLYLTPYFYFVAWVIFSAFISEGHSLYYRVMMILKYVFPIIVYLAVVKSFKTQEEILDFYTRLVSLTPLFILLSIICYFYKSLLLSYVYFTMTIFLVPIIIWDGRKAFLKMVIVMLCLLIPPVIDVKRTPLLACALGLTTFFIFKYRLKAIIPAILVAVSLVLAVFFIPSIKEKFFFDSSISFDDLMHAGLTYDSINSNGRTSFWEYAYNHFFVGHELFGSGTGYVKEFLRSSRNPNAAFSLLHNDLLHILCENGLLGILLFGGFVLSIFHRMNNRIKKTNCLVVRKMAYCCCGFMVITLTHMFFENCINSLTFSMLFLNYAIANKFYYLERKNAKKNSIPCDIKI